jgi:uncharacterized membrane protein
METTMALTDKGRRKLLTPDAGRLAGWDSLYVALVPLPAVFMSATLVSDILYWVTARALWAQVSEWLLGAGLATGAFAAADGLIRYVASGRIRPSRVCWMHVVGNMLALLLSLSNLVYPPVRRSRRRRGARRHRSDGDRRVPGVLYGTTGERVRGRKRGPRPGRMGAAVGRCAQTRSCRRAGTCSCRRRNEHSAGPGCPAAPPLTRGSNRQPQIAANRADASDWQP